MEKVEETYNEEKNFDIAQRNRQVIMADGHTKRLVAWRIKKLRKERQEKKKKVMRRMGKGNRHKC